MDSPEELASWAKDADFPFLFGSDPEGESFTAFGGSLRANGQVDRRAVIVIDPEGRIADVNPSFNQVDPGAYERLQQVIERITPEP